MQKQKSEKYSFPTREESQFFAAAVREFLKDVKHRKVEGELKGINRPNVYPIKIKDRWCIQVEYTVVEDGKTTMKRMLLQEYAKRYNLHIYTGTTVRKTPPSKKLIAKRGQHKFMAEGEASVKAYKINELIRKGEFQERYAELEAVPYKIADAFAGDHLEGYPEIKPEYWGVLIRDYNGYPDYHTILNEYVEKHKSVVNISLLQRDGII